MTTPAALEAIAALAKRADRAILIGAGTVLDPETALQAIHAGADFIVSPVLRIKTIEACRRHDTLVAPGAFTPTEILTAWEHGADIVKVFPATSLGPKFFRDVRGPLPRVRLMPTGGVSIENARDFLEHGACCVAVGTALLNPRAIAEGDWDAIRRKAKELMASLGQGGPHEH